MIKIPNKEPSQQEIALMALHREVSFLRALLFALVKRANTLEVTFEEATVTPEEHVDIQVDQKKAVVRLAYQKTEVSPICAPDGGQIVKRCREQENLHPVPGMDTAGQEGGCCGSGTCGQECDSCGGAKEVV